MSQAKHYWIIGASSGIGEALAIELAKKGHAVAVSARRKERLHEVLSHCPQTQQHLAIPLDVTDANTLQAAYDTILSRWTQIDSVIYMAGDYTPMTLEEMTANAYESIYQINVLGAFRMVELILPYYLKQSFKGQIAICASVAGYRGLPQSQPYGSTKAALINLTESLAVDLGDKIDIKLICPGFVKTRLTDKNTFSMPMRITPDQAAKKIAQGLHKKRFEITTPWLFTRLMKLLKVMPFSLYRLIGARMQQED